MFLGQSRAREQACKQVEILLLSEGTRDVCNLGGEHVRDVNVVVLKRLKAFRGRRIFFQCRFRKVEGEIKSRS